jgi:hypothetical protein
VTVGELLAKLSQLDQGAIVALDTGESNCIVDDVRVVDDVVIVYNCDDEQGRPEQGRLALNVDMRLPEYPKR